MEYNWLAAIGRCANTLFRILPHTSASGAASPSDLQMFIRETKGRVEIRKHDTGANHKLGKNHFVQA